MNRLALPLSVLVLAAGGAATAVAVPRVDGPAPERPPTSTLPLTRLGSVAAAAVCPGPQTLLVPEGGRVVPPPGPVLVAAAASGLAGSTAVLAGQDGAPADGLVLRPPDDVDVADVAVAGLRRTQAGPVRLDARGSGTAPTLSAVQATLATRGDLRGLAASACPVAATDAWLLGGGTGEGHRSRLLLANPTATAVTVDVTVHAEDGEHAPQAGAGVSVPAGGARAVQLDALAPGLGPVAVHLRAVTGRFVASLHHSVLRGLVPGGTDDVVPAAAPSRRQVVPGLSVPDGGRAGLPEDPAAPGAGAVRIAVPGGGDAVVRVGVVGEHGPVALPGAGVLTVPARGVADLALRGLKAGSYAAVVESDVPVVASALVGRTRPGGELAGTRAALGVAVPPSEFAWLPSAVPLARTVLAAVPRPEQPARGGRPAASVSAAVVLTAPDGGAVAHVREVGAGGRVLVERDLEVASGRTVRSRLAPGTRAVLLTLDPLPGGAGVRGPVYGALELSSSRADGLLLAGVVLRPGAEPPAVRPRLGDDRRLGLPGG